MFPPHKESQNYLYCNYKDCNYEIHHMYKEWHLWLFEPKRNSKHRNKSSFTCTRDVPSYQWRCYLWGIGARTPLEFWKFCVFCSYCQLNCKKFENYQRKTCISVSYIFPETH